MTNNQATEQQKGELLALIQQWGELQYQLGQTHEDSKEEKQPALSQITYLWDKITEEFKEKPQYERDRQKVENESSKMDNGILCGDGCLDSSTNLTQPNQQGIENACLRTWPMTFRCNGNEEAKEEYRGQIVDILKAYLPHHQSELEKSNQELVRALESIVWEYENHQPAKRKMHYIAKQALARAAHQSAIQRCNGTGKQALARHANLKESMQGADDKVSKPLVRNPNLLNNKFDSRHANLKKEG